MADCVNEALGGIVLTEDMLTEGKILNKIRWGLAKFSLKFLSEETLNEIIMGYYGKEKGAEKVKGKKKEKVKIVREIADRLPQEKKDQIANNAAAKKLERSGIISAAGGVATAAISGVTAGVLSNAQSKVSAAQNQIDSISSASDQISKSTSEISNNVKDIDNVTKHTTTQAITWGVGDYPDATGFYSGGAEPTIRITGKDNVETIAHISDVANTGASNIASSASTISSNASKIGAAASVASTLLTTIASIFGGLIIAAIAAGVIGLVTGGVKAGIKFKKATTIRKEEIVKELLQSTNKKALEKK